MPSPPLVVPNAVQIRLMYGIANNGAFNVIHARKLGATVITQALTNLIGSGIKAAWSARIAPLAPTLNGLIRVGVRDLSTANQPEYLDTGAVVGGTSVADALPANVASVVTLRTALTGKSKRGRVYIGGFAEDQNTSSGVAADAAATAAVAFLQDVSTALQAQQLTLGVLSRPAYSYTDNRTWTFIDGSQETDVIGRGNARPGGIEDVTLIQSRNANWESQRRRSNGRGSLPALFTPIVSMAAAGNHSDE